MPDIHPFIVHFPLALFLTGLLFDLLGLALADERLVKTGWHLLAASFLASLPAVASGLFAASGIILTPAGRDTFEWHQQLALLAASAIAAVAFWRLRAGGGIPAKPRTLYLLAAIATAGLLIATGLAGGELVFRHGVGVEAVGLQP